MRKMTNGQFKQMDQWMQKHARAYDKAKWNFLFQGGIKENIVEQMLLYQNPDGGMGNGYEPDILLPLSAAIPTAEAIFQSYDYALNCQAPWFQRILDYFETTVQTIPKYWEDCPKEIMDYPHAPWWTYEPCTTFSPNPCAVVASAFIRYGNERQKALGIKIAEDCFDLLLGTGFCGDHDSWNILTLIEQLCAIDSPLITEEILSAMRRRIAENTCYDPSKWNEYYFQPLDFVSSPTSMWYNVVENDVEDNINFWLDSLNNQGVWNLNFSWGVDSDIAKQVTENWKGYIAVKRARILRNFDRIDF